MRPFSPDIVKKIQEHYRIEFSYHSNHLEGNTLTMKETRALLTTQIVASNQNRKLRDWTEMNGHDQAVQSLGLIDGLDFAEDLVKNDRQLTQQDIKNLHQIILGEDYKKTVRDPDTGEAHYVPVIVGQYKTKNSFVRKADGSVFAYAEHFEVAALMGDLLDRLSKHIYTYHPVVVASLFHYKFIRIYPFDDGNGRIARLITNLILMHHRYPLIIVPSDPISKSTYFNALELTDAKVPDIYTAMQDNNIELYEYFIVYMGGLLGDSLDWMSRTLEQGEI